LSGHHIVAVNHKIVGFGQVEEPSRLSGFCCNYGKIGPFLVAGQNGWHILNSSVIMTSASFEAADCHPLRTHH
jgi:hypothetical protein